MDLHDYKDVAENYDRYLEVMYEKQDSYDGFLDFYLELAKENGQDGVIDIACGTGAVALLSVLPEGKKRMSAADFINGRKISTGDVLG